VRASAGARPLDWLSWASKDGMSVVSLSAKGDVEGGVERDAAKRLPEGLGLILEVDASASSTSAAKGFEGSAGGDVGGRCGGEAGPTTSLFFNLFFDLFF
jgi:hypothetical protein